MKQKENEKNENKPKTRIYKRNFSQSKAYVKNLFNDNAPKQLIHNNMNVLKMSFDQNQFNNFQNIQMPMNIMNMNMNFNNMNNINNMQNNMFNFNNNMNYQNLVQENKYLKNENDDLKKKIQIKDEEIQELRAKIENLTNNKPKMVDFNQIRVIQFISTDHSVICGINCLLSDTFALNKSIKITLTNFGG